LSGNSGLSTQQVLKNKPDKYLSGRYRITEETDVLFFFWGGVDVVCVCEHQLFSTHNE